MGKDLLELHAVVVGDLIADNVAGQLGDEVHEGLGALDSKGNVAGAAASRNLKSSLGGRLERLAVKGVDVDLVKAKIRNKEVLLGRVEDSLVGVRAFLTIRIGSLASVSFELDVFEGRRLGNVPGGEAVATANDC